jgi:hypothetical protein
MSVVIREDSSNSNYVPLFEKIQKQRVRRQKGSRDLLFDEEYGNRKKLWNRWTSEQLNFTRKALRDMQRNKKWVRNSKLEKNNENNENNANNNNNYANNQNAKTTNLNNPEWRIGVGNNHYEPVPKILRPNRTLRKKLRK